MNQHDTAIDYQAQQARGDKRRAHRGSPEWWTRPTPAPAPTPPKARAWTDAYQVGQQVLYRTSYRAQPQPGRVHAIIPARADLRTTPELWQSICTDQGQSPDAPPWQIAHTAAMARLVILLTPVLRPSGRLDPARVRVVARASAVDLVSDG